MSGKFAVETVTYEETDKNGKKTGYVEKFKAMIPKNKVAMAEMKKRLGSHSKDLYEIIPNTRTRFNDKGEEIKPNIINQY